jgi:hypothetical protein
MLLNPDGHCGWHCLTIRVINLDSEQRPIAKQRARRPFPESPAARTASHLAEWMSSLRLQPPKWVLVTAEQNTRPMLGSHFFLAFVAVGLAILLAALVFASFSP